MNKAYPQDLAMYIKNYWDKKGFIHEGIKIPVLPEDKYLLELLEVSYHASLLTEESRRVKFRIAFCSPSDVTKYNVFNIIPLTNSREFTTSELLRLAPATDLNKVIICVKVQNSKLEIWGLLDTGISWWKFINNESSSGATPPDVLTITRGGLNIAELKNGEITKSIPDVFYKGPINNFLFNAYSQIDEEVCKELDVEKYDEDNQVLKNYIRYIERILHNIKDKKHGGTLIVVPDELKIGDERLDDRIQIKYPCTYDKGWELVKGKLISHFKYYEHHFKIYEHETISKQDYRTDIRNNGNKKENERNFSDSVQFIASLSGVDGAVLITDKFNLIGFGAEVVASSSIKKVKIAEDALGNGSKFIPIEAYGTRHRSAFRFCSSYENSIAFIISQDGGIKAVKRVGADLVVWPDITSKFLSI